MDSKKGFFTSCAIFLFIYVSVINCAIQNVSAVPSIRNIRQSNENISKDTLDSAPSIPLSIGSNNKSEPLPTPIAQKQPTSTSLNSSTTDSGVVETQNKHSFEKPPIAALNVTTPNRINKEKLPKTNDVLEPMNTESETHTEQKVTKKQLNDKIKNESKIVDKTSNNTANATIQTDSPVRIDLTPNNVTISTDKIIDKTIGAKKRGFIVFGSLGLMVLAYIAYKKYRRGRNNHSSELCFDASDSQFKYDMLNSNDMADNLEMANIPLTIDTDDDEELEIFDLQGKKHFNKVEAKDGDVNGHLLAKDDVEILDLDIPGYSRSAARRASSQDDDLLNLDEVIDEVLKSSSNRNISKDHKTDTSNNLFDIL